MGIIIRKKNITSSSSVELAQREEKVKHVSLTWLHWTNFTSLLFPAFIQSCLTFSDGSFSHLSLFRAYESAPGHNITKTRLFKYIENFTTKNWKFSDTNSDIFSYFCSKHRLWVLVRTASLCFWAEMRKIMYFPANPGLLNKWPASVAQLDAPSDWRPGGRGFNPRRGRQHSFVEIDHEIFSTVILSLPLIQEGQLSVSGERMCIILVNRLED